MFLDAAVKKFQNKMIFLWNTSGLAQAICDKIK